MSFLANDVAEYFLSKAWEEKKDITPMKLNKLVYLAHGFTLAYLGENLIDEEIEAWKYGPVVPSVYHEFKSFGQRLIEPKSVSIKTGDLFSPEVKKVLDAVWSKFKDWTGVELSEFTHEPKSPWSQVYISGQYFEHISNALIKNYFTSLLARTE